MLSSASNEAKNFSSNLNLDYSGISFPTGINLKVYNIDCGSQIGSEIRKKP